MNKNTFEKKYKVKLVSKKDDKLMRFIGLFSKSFTNNFWTTYRLPFQDPKITYPPSVKNPTQYSGVLEHELVHCEYIRSNWGLFKAMWLVSIFPLPVLFSGRWLLEQNAYLLDITKRRLNIEDAVNILWSGYGWCWPKKLMRKWFEKKVLEHKKSKEK